jgi:HK97 family phage major capsid protein
MPDNLTPQELAVAVQDQIRKAIDPVVAQNTELVRQLEDARSSIVSLQTLQNEQRAQDLRMGSAVVTIETDEQRKAIATKMLGVEIMTALHGGGQDTAARFAKGFFADNQRLVDMAVETRTAIRGQATNNFELGGALMQNNYINEMIMLLCPPSIVERSGARVMNLVLGENIIPKQTGATMGFWLAEGSTVTLTNVEVGQLNLSLKKLGALAVSTSELLKNPTTDIIKLIVEDIGMSFAAKQDLAFLRGAGTNSTSPTGIRYAINSGNVLYATSGLSATPTLSELLEVMTSQLATYNVPMTKPAWYMSPRMKAKFEYAKSTTGQFIYRDEMSRGTLAGYPFYVSSQIQNNYVYNSVTGLTELYLGDAAELIVGKGGGFDVQQSKDASFVDQLGNAVNSFLTDQVLVRAITYVDFGVKHTRAFIVALVDPVNIAP